jgi:hypothetical protein
VASVLVVARESVVMGSRVPPASPPAPMGRMGANLVVERSPSAQPARQIIESTTTNASPVNWAPSVTPAAHLAPHAMRGATRAQDPSIPIVSHARQADSTCM